MTSRPPVIEIPRLGLALPDEAHCVACERFERIRCGAVAAFLATYFTNATSTNAAWMAHAATNGAIPPSLQGVALGYLRGFLWALVAACASLAGMFVVAFAAWRHAAGRGVVFGALLAVLVANKVVRVWFARRTRSVFLRYALLWAYEAARERVPSAHLVAPCDDGEHDR